MAKKALVIIFSLIAVIAIIFVLWNFVFGQDVVAQVMNKFIGRINEMWKSVTKSSDNLIPEMETSANSTMGGDW